MKLNFLVSKKKKKGKAPKHFTIHKLELGRKDEEKASNF